MKLRFLGTGTSNGVPVIGCTCKVCKSNNAKDKRLRTSALLETETTRILIDCGPDFRQQILPVPYKKIDGILITHIHYDHVGGIDDLRPFSWLSDLEIYANKDTCQGLRHNFQRASLPGCSEAQSAHYCSTQSILNRRLHRYTHRGNAWKDAYYGLPHRQLCIYHRYENN